MGIRVYISGRDELTIRDDDGQNIWWITLAEAEHIARELDAQIIELRRRQRQRAEGQKPRP